MKSTNQKQNEHRHKSIQTTKENNNTRATTQNNIQSENSTTPTIQERSNQNTTSTKTKKQYQSNGTIHKKYRRIEQALHKQSGHHASTKRAINQQKAIKQQPTQSQTTYWTTIPETTSEQHENLKP